jgi:hypothetical protein
MKHILKLTMTASAAAMLCLGSASVAAAQEAPSTDAMQMKTEKMTENAAFNAFLTKYVSQKGDLTVVAYGDVTDSDKASLDGYIETLSKSGPPSGSDEAIMAYWFNLYNAKTISVILDNYPVKSIRDIGGGLFASGPWKDKNLTVAGKSMSLDDIEHGTVRAKYDEPRVHYAFNCASIGCPNLKTTAWKADTLESDLTQAARDYVNSPRGVRRDSKDRLVVSEIYKWYKEDFGGNQSGILNHLNVYADAETKAALNSAKKIDKFDYNWSLNVKN